MPPRAAATAARRKTRRGTKRGGAEDADDYLDAAGLHNNMFTNEPFTERYETGKANVRWNSLPMYRAQNVALIVNSIKANDVTLLIAGTGAGKTVIAPKLAYKFAKDAGLTGRVVVTNPKKVTTAENALTSAEIADVDLGREIGMKYRGSDPKMASAATVLEYVTDGYLLTRSRMDPLMSEYSVVMVDEVHERAVPTDFMLLALRNALVARRGTGFKALIVSATMDPAVFRTYFGKVGLSVGLVDVEGQPPQPIEVRWAPPKTTNYVAEAVQHALAYVRNPTAGFGSVLVFVPTVSDATKGCRALDKACVAAGMGTACEENNLWCRRLHAKAAPREVEEAKRLPEGQQESTQRVIFSTNVAESSITIKDLRCVIDTGFELDVRYDAERDADVIGKQWITQANAQQRKGRVGRVHPGVCVRMYSEAAFKALKEMPLPKIATMDVTENVWSMLVSPGYAGDWAAVAADLRELPTPPSAAQMRAALHGLVLLGLLDPVTLKLSAAGGAIKRIVELFKNRVSFASAVLLAAGVRCGAVPEAALMVAIVEATKGKMGDLWRMRGGPPSAPAELPEVPLSEHLKLMSVYGYLFVAQRTPKAAAMLDAIKDGVYEGRWKDIQREYEIIGRKMEAWAPPAGALDSAAPWSLVQPGSGFAGALMLARLKSACCVEPAVAVAVAAAAKKGGAPGDPVVPVRRLFGTGVYYAPAAVGAKPGDMLVAESMSVRLGLQPECSTVTVFPATADQCRVFAASVRAATLDRLPPDAAPASKPRASRAHAAAASPRSRSLRPPSS